MLNLKRNLFVICFLMFSLNVFSQPKSPIIGYDKVAWGASIQAVIQVYPTIKERTSDDASVGVREFTQSNVGNGIDNRSFFFYNNKLYKVVVSYEEQREALTAFNALASKLVDIYGKFGKQNQYNEPLYDYTMEINDLINDYNKDLTIILRAIETYNRNNVRVKTYITCLYFNPNIADDIDVAKTKQKGNSFGL